LERRKGEFLQLLTDLAFIIPKIVEIFITYQKKHAVGTRGVDSNNNVEKRGKVQIRNWTVTNLTDLDANGSRILLSIQQCSSPYLAKMVDSGE
jgi:hypothetical protein